MLVLEILRLNLNVWMLGKIPMAENRSKYSHLFPPSPDPDVVRPPPTPESQFPPNPVGKSFISSSCVNVVRLRDSSGRFLPRSDSHQSAHDESENSRDGQPIRVDAPDHAVIPCDVEMQGEEFEVGANDQNPNYQCVSKRILLLNHNRTSPLSHDCHIHEDESLLNSLRETCARDSQRRVFLLFPQVKLLWHSFSADSLEPACLSNKQWKKGWCRSELPCDCGHVCNCVIQGSCSC